MNPFYCLGGLLEWEFPLFFWLLFHLPTIKRLKGIFFVFLLLLCIPFMIKAIIHGWLCKYEIRVTLLTIPVILLNPPCLLSRSVLFWFWSTFWTLTCFRLFKSLCNRVAIGTSKLYRAIYCYVDFAALACVFEITILCK